MKFTFYGHACFSVEMNGKTILFDPFISGNELAKDVNIDSIQADYILLSHGHADHIADVESIATRTGATIVSTYEVASYYGAKEYAHHPMNHGGKWNFDFGTVKMVNAVHSSSFPDGKYAGNPAGFVIWNDNHCFYYSGDTALTMDMKLIPMTCPKVDVAILCIGDNFTMGIEDAVLAAQFVETENVVGVHFDTFGYIKIDQDLAASSFAKAGKSLLLPTIGESYDL